MKHVYYFLQQLYRDFYTFIKLWKLIVIIAIIASPGVAVGQIVGATDISVGAQYTYNSRATSCGNSSTTFTWSVSGGTIIAGGSGSSYVTVQWSGAGSVSLLLKGIQRGSSRTDPSTPVTCYNGTLAVKIIAPKPGVAAAPTPICANTGFYLNYNGSAYVSAVDWYRVTPTGGVLLGRASTPADGFQFLVPAGIKQTTEYYAQPVSTPALAPSTIQVDVITSQAGRIEASSSQVCANSGFDLNYVNATNITNVRWSKLVNGTWQFLADGNAAGGFTYHALSGISQTTEFSAVPTYCSSLPTTYEAEDVPPTQRNVPIASAGSFVENFTEQGRFISFTVDVPQAGNYSIDTRYSAGSTPSTLNRMSVYVNDMVNVRSKIFFAGTNGWTTWALQSTLFSLEAGKNTIKYQVNADEGWINIDNIRVMPATYQAEDAENTGYVYLNYSGSTGRGIVGDLNYNSPNRYVLFSLDVPTEGYYSVNARYAAYGSAQRTMSIYVNDMSVVRTKGLFPGTNGWDQWAMQSTVLALQAGRNTIKYVVKDGDDGFVNLDFIQISPLATTRVEVLSTGPEFAGLAFGGGDVTQGSNKGTIQLVDYSGTILKWQTQENGGVWQDLSQNEEQVTYYNLLSTTQFRALVSRCGQEQYSQSCTVRVQQDEDGIHWTEAIAYGEPTQIISSSRSYFDQLGAPLQSQAKNLSRNSVLAFQPLRDRYDRIVGNTLAAPIGSSDFAYKPVFITRATDATRSYDHQNFDTNTTLNAPEAVGNTTIGTLGWYYSTNNTIEPYTAITGYPYSRTDAMPDGSTDVSRSAGPGVGLQMGSTREGVQGSFPVRTELNTYAAIRSSLLSKTTVGEQVATMQQAAVQHLSTDADGTTALVFADKEGHAVMSARPATSTDAWTTATNTVEVGWPYSAQLTYKGLPVSITATSDLMLYNSQGQWIATGTPEAIAQALATSGQSYQTYSLYSNDSFTVSDGAGTVANAQWREAYAYFNFYIVGDGTATITSQPATPTTEYEIVNTVTGNTVTLSSTSPLAPGCYQVRIKKGAIRLVYTNRFKDISYSFYNQKGQVVESIAPNGVKKLLQDWLTNGSANLTATFATTYEYDQQDRQTATTETDAGRTEFFYRTDGKLRFSQNARQRALGYFSYVNYDNIGRVIEVGESRAGNSALANFKTTVAILDYTPVYGVYDDGGMGCQERRDIVRTYYDRPVDSYTLPSGYETAFLPGRVAATVKASLFIPCTTFQEVAHTIFSYDEQGRTLWQIQQTLGQPARTIDYVYDATGNTKTVCYQKGVPTERLTHYYNYDADNRLSTVSTSNYDPTNPPSSSAPTIPQASYYYYLHGPLKRVVYAPNISTGIGLQGVDYTYTANGQLKAINDGDILRDPGKDGVASASAQYADFFGISLNYYPNDYTSAAIPSLLTTMATGSSYKPHYNGLVSGIAWQTPGSAYNAYGYNYDEKGQFLQAAYGLLTPTMGRQYSFAPDNVNRYGENLPTSSAAPAYDPNGNISRLQRMDGTGNATPLMDGGYQYISGTNKLDKINVGGNPVMSYTYDEIGQIVTQQESDPTKTKYLAYDATGHVTDIYKDSNSQQPIAHYTYDEYGKRIVQQVYPNPLDPSTYTTTTFVRDIFGYELASYVAVTTNGTTTPTFLYEQPIYGATRLGINRRARDQAPAEQLYELNDQLGNTRVVFKQPTSTTYLLSMEDSQQTQEKQDFPGPTVYTYDNTKTSEHFYGSGAYTYYDPSTGAQPGHSIKLVNQQGPTKTIVAQRGDKLHLSVYASYSNSTGEITASKASSPVIMPFVSTGKQVDKVAPANETAHSTSGLARLLSQFSVGIAVPLGKTATNRTVSTLNLPQAVLQYVIRRHDNGQFVRNGIQYITAQSEGNWVQLQLDATITESYPVDIEISTQNYDGGQAVYFDDLSIQYTTGPVIEENNYYAYGQRLDELSWRRTDEQLYGRGYQGQYATQDTESGYTSFDLRMYDARYGRWLAMDPKGQFFSPYIGMGNNPISLSDYDGGLAGNDQGPASQGAPVQGPARDAEMEKYGVTMGMEGGVTVVGFKPTPSAAPNDLVVSTSMWKTQLWDMQACNRTCRAMIGYTPGVRIQLYMESGKRLVPQPTLQKGLKRLDEYLAEQKPVMVGVSHTFGAGYNEGTTDHFLVIVGSGYSDGVRYYRYFDPGRLTRPQGASPLNRLYLQANGQYSGDAPGLKHKDGSPMNYTLDQVRFR